MKGTNPTEVLRTRRRWNAYLLPFFVALMVIGTITVWLTGQLRFATAPLAVLPLWALLRFCTPREEIDKMASSEPLEVYSAADIHEAHFIKAVLEEAGIEARVVGDHLQNAVGDLPAVTIAPRIWVHAENFDQARKIIADYQARRLSRTAPANDWKCAQCGELNDPSFEICWKCQTARNGE